jgi:hypothetical protein
VSRGPGWLFVAGLAVFALLGLLASSPPPRAARESPDVSDVHSATDASPVRRRRPAQDRLSEPRKIKAVVTRSPRELARSWGRLWASWSARTLADQLSLLAESASPTLAAELRAARRATRADEHLAGEQTGSRGVVEAVHVGEGTAARRVIVVTREAPYGPSGPDPAGSRYRVYVGLAVPGRTGEWSMAEWERQP